jgi:pilus assembly protein CpaB
MGNRRAILFLGLAILLGVLAAFAAQRWLEAQAPPEAGSPFETASVVVARTDVPIGTALSTTQLATVEWPKRYAPQGSFTNAADVEGRVLRRAVGAGEPILESVLLPQGSAAGLAPVISESKRAVSVKVDAVIGVAGFVRPGSRIDLLVTLDETDETGKPISKVVLQNVPVLAIDQKMEEVKKGEPELVNVVTLEVDPEQAEKLAYGAHEGRLQLALRNPADTELVETSGATAPDLLGERKRAVRPVARGGAPRPVASVEVLRGSERSVKSF